MRFWTAFWLGWTGLWTVEGFAHHAWTGWLQLAFFVFWAVIAVVEFKEWREMRRLHAHVTKRIAELGYAPELTSVVVQKGKREVRKS